MIQKNQTVRRDYHVAISTDGKTVATVTVRAEGVRDSRALASPSGGSGRQADRGLGSPRAGESCPEGTERGRPPASARKKDCG